MEDKAGGEEIYLQSERDWNIYIKSDKGQTVGHDKILTVVNNRDKTVAVNTNKTIGAAKELSICLYQIDA